MAPPAMPAEAAESHPSPGPMAHVLPEGTLYCSFCLKSQHEVAKLVAGPGNIFIWDECVGLCNVYIEGGRPDLSHVTPPHELPDERLLERLKPVSDELQGKGSQLQWLVDTLRSRDVSWAAIGGRLGVSHPTDLERISLIGPLLFLWREPVPSPRPH